MAEPWSLHPQLEADTIALGELSLSRALLNDDVNFPWIILVPRQPRLVDLTDLNDAAPARLYAEIKLCAGALKSVTGYDKLNVAALGNVVPQLHIHIIARFRRDAAWPNPVWGRVERRPYERLKLDALAGALRAKIGIPPSLT